MDKPPTNIHSMEVRRHGLHVEWGTLLSIGLLKEVNMLKHGLDRNIDEGFHRGTPVSQLLASLYPPALPLRNALGHGAGALACPVVGISASRGVLGGIAITTLSRGFPRSRNISLKHNARNDTPAPSNLQNCQLDSSAYMDHVKGQVKKAVYVWAG